MKKRTVDETAAERASRWVADQAAEQAAEREVESALDGIWVTAEQIAAVGALGLGKSVNAVRCYIKRHKLSNHPKWCRKAAGRGTTLEYNVRLFLPHEVAARKVGRWRKVFHLPRELDMYQEAEGGELFREIYAHVVWARMIGDDISSAEPIRNHCIRRFGKTIMKADDPDDRIVMPRLRAFRKIMDHIETLDPPPKIDRNLLHEMAGLSGKPKEELIEIIKSERKARAELIAKVMKVIKGAKLTRDPDALRRRIDQIDGLITGRERY